MTTTQDPPAGSARATLETFHVLPSDARVKTETICTLLACSRTTLWRRVKAGAFPAPIRQASNVVRWRVGDVRKHLAGNAA
ncbi:AlpA family phage regulatory protein [Variovorax paradoxus]|nr:AlpA family phage regulatory protein [Variovorax paradoxus]MBT2304695.1 AlpA family phage regulatory protein [Variovorax paradoxus]